MIFIKLVSQPLIFWSKVRLNIYLLLAIDVGVQQPEDVLEVALLPGDERYSQKGRMLALTSLDRGNCDHMDFVQHLDGA